MMPKIPDLEQSTNNFFKRHWNEIVLNEGPPVWSQPYNFIGSAPNHDKEGIYAFFKNGEIIYIGIGASQGSGKYFGHGLGSRLHNKYLRVCKGGRAIEDSKRPYEFKDEKWKEVDHLLTLGFKKECGYLAYGLEIFLIRELKPKHNTQQK